LCGVLDWGDLHYGHAAVDLMAIHQLIPSHHHDAFFATYGSVDERTWRFARFRAIHHTRMVAEYCRAIDDPALAASARTAAGFLGLQLES
jgi:aminoglycoside phosphotransferase (APT) family kinase protein